MGKFDWLIKLLRGYIEGNKALYRQYKQFNGSNGTNRYIQSAIHMNTNPKKLEALAEYPMLSEMVPLYKWKDVPTTNLVQVGDKVQNSMPLVIKDTPLQYLLRGNEPISEHTLNKAISYSQHSQKMFDLAPRYARFINHRYKQAYNQLSQDKVWKSIIDESPQYLNDIYKFTQKYPNYSPEQQADFVKLLIQRANSYRRYMNRPVPVEEAIKLNGRHEGSIDVEGISRSDFSGEYGNYPYYFVGHPELSGPVETWWSQRIPKGVTVEIGMHSKPIYSNKLQERVFKAHKDDDKYSYDPGVTKLFNQYLEVPQNFKAEPWHQLFTGNKGSILPNFTVTTEMPENFRFGRGYKQGGKVKKRCCKKSKC